MFQTLLTLDTNALIWARTLVGPEYAIIIQYIGESIVLWSGVFLVGLWLFGLKEHDNRYKVAALMIFSTIILTFIVYTLINFGVGKWRPGPQEVVNGVAPLIPHPLDNSFPSGHALFTGAFLVGLFAFARYPIIIFTTIIFGLLTAISRVIGGVHYPGDIIGGWLFGAIGGLIFMRVVTLNFFREKIFFPIIRLLEYIRL